MTFGQRILNEQIEALFFGMLRFFLLTSIPGHDLHDFVKLRVFMRELSRN